MVRAVMFPYTTQGVPSRERKQMSRALNEALDNSLTLLETKQATIEGCLSRHSQHTAALRPLLETAMTVSQAPTPKASAMAFAAGRRRMLAALAEKKQRRLAFPNLFTDTARAVVQRRAYTLQWAAAVSVALILLIVGVMIVQTWPEARLSQVATLEQVQGSVEIQGAGSDTWQPASADDQVEAGDQIRTGSLAGVTLVFFDGSTAVLEAETKIAIARMDANRDGSGKVILLRQDVGQSYSRVQPLTDSDSRFEIETPTAVMAVRGTEFALAVEPDGTTRVTVVEGIVDMTAEGVAISVAAGQMAEARPGIPPASALPVELTSPGQTKTPQPPGQTGIPSTKEPEITEATEPKPTPVPPQPTPIPVPPEPTSVPPEPTSKPPEPTSVPPEPTQKPHPTHPPHPTKKP
jgi:hypothetical protein